MPRSELIYNPVGGGGSARLHLERVVGALAGSGWQVRPVPTLRGGEATRLAREAADRHLEVVFALGGDGHLREVAAGLLGSPTALAPLPGGTTNVVCRELELPLDPVATARRLAAAETRSIDVGLCADEPFLMQASAGLDAVALAQVSRRWKRRVGRLAVVAAGLSVWRRGRAPRLQVRSAERTLAGSFVAAANLSRYGGDLQLVPSARLDDGRLHLVVFSGRGRGAALGFARDLLMGRHLDRSDVVVQPVERVTLEQPARPPLQLDGDPFAAAAPVHIRLAPARLRLLVPKQAREAL